MMKGQESYSTEVATEMAIDKNSVIMKCMDINDFIRVSKAGSWFERKSVDLKWKIQIAGM